MRCRLAFTSPMGLLLALTLATLFPRPARAAVLDSYVPAVPADASGVEVYLVTVGLGSDVASRFGHTGIRIKDPEHGTDLVYNWGKFYFDEPLFLWKFFRGSLPYSMGIRTFPGDVQHYLRSGQRLVMDHVNLTPLQKHRLLDKIAWNAAPEHRRFPYQYWYRNCATIPRDYLDEALGGAIKGRLALVDSGKAFRHYVRSNLAASPFVVPVLDILMNGNIDRPINAWEEMFLPAKLREHLLTQPALADDGTPRAGVLLLSGGKVLLDRPEDMTPALPDYLILTAPMVLLALAATVFLLREAALGWRLLGGLVASFGLVAGVFGLTLALDWAFSGHPDGWHNVNLLLFFPTDLLIVPLGLALLRAGQPVRDRLPFIGFGRLFVMAHAIGLAVLLLWKLAGGLEQDVWTVLAHFAPPLLVLCALLWIYGFAPSAETVPVAAAGGDLQAATAASRSATVAPVP